ncbi:MAG TPA: lysylphosphatidylglycerol synthase transmembrane domain-containing protein [Dehalococcoidia bacterium]
MKRFLPAAKVLLSAGALTAIFMRIDVRDAAATLANADPAWVGLALLVNLVAVALSSLLWRSVIVGGDKPRIGNLLRAYLGGLFYNNLGFGTAPGDASRIAALAAANGPGRAAVSVLAERVLSLVALLALASGGAALLFSDRPVLATGIWVVVAAGIAALGILAYAVPHAVRRFRGLSRLTVLLEGTNDAALALLHDPRRLGRGLFVAIGVQSCTVVAAMCTTAAVGAPLPPITAFAVVPLIALLVLMPVSVQGIGVRESTYVYFLAFAAIDAEHALGAAFLSYCTTLIVSLAGGGVLVAEAVASRRRQARTESDSGLRVAA